MCDLPQVNDYRYLVIGGQHLVRASQQIRLKDQSAFKTRHCVVYADVTQDQIMWLSNRHNVTHSCHKVMSLKDKVTIILLDFE